ncbi:MAG: NYN domain-containing protein [Armatimonadetes bacterium]|nr:NYN domain-containing protein [Armatimonadota bacterium]
MKEYLIVDGYNIIFAWPHFEELRKSGLEHARLKLIDILVNYAALTGRQVILVFDAYRVRESAARTEEMPGLQVIYTAFGETADSLIEKLVGELSREGAVYVATSDWAEQRMVLGQGACRLTPQELLDSIRQEAKAGKRFCSPERPADAYLENRLKGKIRVFLENWRRKKT